MPGHGRARFASKYASSHTGTGRVISPINLMGRTMAVRKAIIRRVGSGKNCTKDCYNSKQMMGKMF